MTKPWDGDDDPEMMDQTDAALDWEDPEEELELTDEAELTVVDLTDGLIDDDLAMDDLAGDDADAPARDLLDL